MSNIQVPPQLKHNQRLIDNVRPDGWRNPTPDGRYNLVVIGGGSAGLVAASGAAGLGAKVALIEKNYLGGDCLNVGCVPSKAIIRAAKVVGELQRGADLGITVDGISADFQSVMDHVRRARADIAPHDSAQRYRDLGVDVFFGEARFTGATTIEVDGQTLTFRKALIATGSRPAPLPIDGLAETGYLTNESIWNLYEQPRTLAIIGAGPIGVELAQSFQRLGTDVTLLEVAPRILPREDRDAAAVVEEALLQDGVALRLDVRIGRVSAESSAKQIEYELDGDAHRLVVDEILVAAGRAPNVEGLGLEAAGVEYNRHGVVVDDTLQTTNSAVYAAGDVAMAHKFTHAAGHAAAIVLQNALFPTPARKLSNLIIPWATYSDPEIAHVGLYPQDAEAQGIAVDTFMQSFDGVDRAVTDAETEGFIKVHVQQGSDKIVGATIVGRHAGELISQVTMAMKYDIGLSKIVTTVFPYPTQAEALHKVASTYNRTRLTPTVKKLFNWWLARTR